MPNKSYRLTISLLVILLGLDACGLGEKKMASQVAATVNGADITIQLINQVLSHTPGITVENTEKARKEILDRLILQELAVSKATESKLEQTPEVIMALEASRRDILARAYLNKVAGSADNIDKAEATRYFNEHPELFSQRRIYSLRDISLQSDEKLNMSLQDMVAKNKSMQAIAGWLKGKNINFKESDVSSASEKLSMEILPKIAKLKVGQSTVIVTGQVMHVVSLTQSIADPVNFDTALPQIQQYLGAERRQQIVSSELKKLRDTAKVIYMGEFAAAKPEGAPVSGGTLNTQAADPAKADAAGITKGAEEKK